AQAPQERGHFRPPHPIGASASQYGTRGAPRLRRGAERGGLGGPLGPPHLVTALAERHGSAGARSVGGLGGPLGASASRYGTRGAPRLRRGAARGGLGGPARGLRISLRHSRSATAPPGRGAWGAWGARSRPPITQQSGTLSRRGGSRRRRRG